jgi:lipopolysaccharide export system permease protein
MPLIERYIFRRAAHVFLVTLGALTVVLWATQVMRELDVVTAKGQSIWIFLLITLFALPALVQIVAPAAFLVGSIVTLNSLAVDSELPVVAAAGAPRTAVNRPIIVLAAAVTIAVAVSHHVLAPASLANLRSLLTRVRADVIATLVQGGGFREVDEGLTMHFRERTADDSFRDVFVHDERNPEESLSFSAARSILLEYSGGSFLVLEDGDIVRSNKRGDTGSVVHFETYALDLSQIGAADAAPVYRAMERSTFLLMDPGSSGPNFKSRPQRVRAEIHDRIAAPLYTLVFAFITLGFLSRPSTSRENRILTIVAVVALCITLRAAGFAAFAIGRNTPAAFPFTHAIPLSGIALGIYLTARSVAPETPPVIAAAWEGAVAFAQRSFARLVPSIRTAQAGRRP